MKFISVNVYRNSAFGDCSMNGVTATDDYNLVVPVANGYITEEDVEKNGYVVLEPMRPASATCPPRFKERGEKRMVMSGGNFVYSSDSRFRREYGGPVSVHDRYEG